MSASTPAAEAPAADEPLLASRHTGLLTIAVMAISVIQFLDITIANVALPHMQASLGASVDTISWVMTSFIIAGVLVMPLTGWLSDRLGSRNLFIGASILFLVASMLCGAATSLTQMVLFRAVQGMAAAIIGPMSQTIMFDINPPSKQPRAMQLWSMVVMIGPISGPFIGGFLTDALNWRWVFYVNLPIGIPAVALLWWLLPSRQVIRRRLDLFGAIWLAIGLCALQLMLDRGQHKDWFEAREIVIYLLIVLCAFWVFAVHTRTGTRQLFSSALFRDRNFIAGLVFSAVVGITNIALSSVLPVMFQSIYHYSVIDTGMMLAPRGVGILIAMIVVTRLIERIDLRVLITLGYIIAASSMVMMAGWSLEMDRERIIMSLLIQGIGLGMIFGPANILAFARLSPALRPEGTTLMTLSRNLGSSLGLAIMVTMLSRNMQGSHTEIAASVTSYSIPAIDPATSAAQLGTFGSAALYLLEGEVWRQAAFIAYLDNFIVMAWVIALVTPMAWLLKPVPPEMRRYG